MKNFTIKTKVWLWMGIIIVLSFLPGSSFNSVSPFIFPHTDKLVHFFIYFIMCLLWLQFFKSLGIGKVSAIAYSLIISILFGMSMEFFQEVFTNKRTGEFWDFAANCLGAITAVFSFSILNRNKLFRKIIS
ncbi:MAG: VanZ family protein [Bacteroidales bacterium]|nr:VanZ family protein [Bacteroidales bacterium]